jgi:hypothetical protein
VGGFALLALALLVWRHGRQAIEDSVKAGVGFQPEVESRYDPGPAAERGPGLTKRLLFPLFALREFVRGLGLLQELWVQWRKDRQALRLAQGRQPRISVFVKALQDNLHFFAIFGFVFAASIIFALTHVEENENQMSDFLQYFFYLATVFTLVLRFAKFENARWLTDVDSYLEDQTAAGLEDFVRGALSAFALLFLCLLEVQIRDYLRSFDHEPGLSPYVLAVGTPWLYLFAVFIISMLYQRFVRSSGGNLSMGVFASFAAILAFCWTVLPQLM